MNEIDPRKYLDKINNRNNINKRQKFIKYLRNLFVRTSIVAIAFLSMSIVYKSNNALKEKVNNYVFEKNISFTKIQKLYNKYLGGILPLKKEVGTEKVFNETLKYNSSSVYHDGVKLFVENNYLVPSLDGGMVVFIGEKDSYGNTIIVENLDGVHIWYGNITNTSLKLYDYVEKGDLLGEATKELYLVFSKNDKYLSYEEYLK